MCSARIGAGIILLLYRVYLKYLFSMRGCYIEDRGQFPGYRRIRHVCQQFGMSVAMIDRLYPRYVDIYLT